MKSIVSMLCAMFLLTGCGESVRVLSNKDAAYSNHLERVLIYIPPIGDGYLFDPKEVSIALKNSFSQHGVTVETVLLTENQTWNVSMREEAIRTFKPTQIMDIKSTGEQKTTYGNYGSFGSYVSGLALESDIYDGKNNKRIWRSSIVITLKKLPSTSRVEPRKDYADEFARKIVQQVVADRLLNS